MVTTELEVSAGQSVSGSTFYMNLCLLGRQSVNTCHLIGRRMCSAQEEVLSQRDARAAHMQCTQCHNARSSFIRFKFTAEHLKEGSENMEVRKSVCS